MRATDNMKFFLVLLSVLALIPLLFLVPGVYNTLPNRYGVILGIGPMAIFMASAVTCKPSEFMFFVSGLLLITLGVMFFATGEAIVSMAKAAYEAKRLNDTELRFMTDGMSLWLYSLPVISVGVGINLVSSYLSTSHSASREDKL